MMGSRIRVSSALGASTLIQCWGGFGPTPLVTTILCSPTASIGTVAFHEPCFSVGLASTGSFSPTLTLMSIGSAAPVPVSVTSPAANNRTSSPSRWMGQVIVGVPCDNSVIANAPSAAIAAWARNSDCVSTEAGRTCGSMCSDSPSGSSEKRGRSRAPLTHPASIRSGAVNCDLSAAFLSPQSVGMYQQAIPIQTA